MIDYYLIARVEKLSNAENVHGLANLLTVYFGYGELIARSLVNLPDAVNIFDLAEKELRKFCAFGGKILLV